MHGYGYPPQQQPTRRPSSATLTTLRVLFVALTLMSCGFLSWAALLRLATVTRKGLDWTLMAAALALNAGMFAYVLSWPDNDEPLTDTQGVIFFAWLLCTVAGTVAYYLYAEIRHYSRRYTLPVPSPYTGHVPPRAPAVTPAAPTPGYGYPPAPAPPAGPVRPPAPAAPPTATPPPTPRTAPPQRLDQVRAELDELSDYLRKEGGNR
ncbi:hypothetical protein AB0K86_03220 [Streptomyces clavifer]|uniref:hypothetical protein n=1 Tax=Streptomyces TaxID=1883 RepID=UPI000701FB29|nr:MULTISPECIES: hypothetical protein [unclassified Streptomyces]KQX90683.1 hypothetical protein ASD26_24850 [Streptomyces sp. Root1319]KQZ03377.1 hypothetical protein ASD51_19925 [Streptomyces sp. Root55]